MRNITHIVVHHSATPIDLSPDKSLASFNNTHKHRFYIDMPIKQRQVEGPQPYPYIAYHYCIDKNGIVYETRPHYLIGYHAGNWNINKTSLGICLIGNFDLENPTQKQMDALKKLCKTLVEQYKIKKENIIFHRDIPKTYKTCPGININLTHKQDIQSYCFGNYKVKEKIAAPWLIPQYTEIERRGTSLWGYHK